MLVMKPHQRLKQNARPARGATMIEVLIAILVISIGLLGIAALQTTALKTASDSYNLTQATIQAIDLEERLWAAACILSKSSDTAAAQAAGRIVTQWRAQPDDIRLEPRRIVSFITPLIFRGPRADWQFIALPDANFFAQGMRSLEFPYRISWGRHATGDPREAQTPFEGFTFAVLLPPRNYFSNLDTAKIPNFCPP